MVWAYVFLAVPFAYFVLVDLVAMASSFVFSFQNYLTIGTERSWAGWDNYRNALDDPLFFTALKNTFIFGAIRVPVLLVLSLVVALALQHIRRLRAFYQVLYFLPFVTSGVAIAWVFKFMYLPNFGLFTHVFDALGLPRADFLGDPKTALVSIAAVTIWGSIGFYTLILRAGLEDIPAELYEAAKVDGATAWQRFRHITIPLLNRTIVLVSVLCMISSLQNFTYVRLLSSDGFGGPLDSTISTSLLIYKEAFFAFDMGKASAIAVIFFAIIMVLTLIQRKAITREHGES